MGPEQRSHREPPTLTVNKSDIVHTDKGDFVSYGGTMRKLQRNRVGGGKGFWRGFSWVQVTVNESEATSPISQKHRSEPGTFASHSAKKFD